MYSLINLIFVLVLATSLQARVIKDLHNQEITVPDKTDKVFGSSPPMNYLIYALNPEKMIGLNFKAKNPNNYADEKFLNKTFLSLPVIGSLHGGGKRINLENLIKNKPDLILLWEDDMLVGKVTKEIEKTKIPTIVLPFRKVEDMPKSIRFAGEVINETKRGNLLASYADNVITEIQSSLKDVKPIRYYYAEGIDGLSTECDSSFHVEALNFAGGENVHKCQQSGILGLEKINFETLFTYDPEIIVAQNHFVYEDILFNPLWENLHAVKNKKVYLIPNNPFNWVDRPPSFMRVIGIQWLTNLFHPKEYNIDINQRVTEFYELFLGVKLTNKETKNLLGEQL